MTPELDSVKKTAEALLEARDVLDIDRYGWLDLDDMDPTVEWASTNCVSPEG